MSDMRWNDAERVWEFNAPCWGGWSILRETPRDTSRPMTYEQGMAYIAERYAIAEMRQNPGQRIQVVRFDDTQSEPRRVEKSAA